MHHETSPAGDYEYHPETIEGGILVDEIELVFRQHNVAKYIDKTYGENEPDLDLISVTKITTMAAFAGVMALSVGYYMEKIGTQLIEALRHLPY